MTNYFEAPDGHDEPTLWAVSGNQHAVPVLRRSDVPKFWPDVVARMTGTTITTDSSTVERIARCLYEYSWEALGGASWDDNPTEATKETWRIEARAILAALTGVPPGVKRTDGYCTCPPGYGGYARDCGIGMHRDRAHRGAT